MNEPSIKDKNYTFKQKLEYFWMYYKVHTIVVVLAVIILGSVLKTWVFQKDLVLLVSAFDSGNVEETTLEEDFMAYAGIDTAHEDVVIQHDGALSDEMNQYAIANNMKVIAQVNSGELDILITLKDKFEDYAQADCYKDLREVFSEEELKAFELVMDSNNRPVGIKTASLPGLAKYGLYNSEDEDKQGIVGVVINSERIENIKKFTKFIMEN